MLVVSMAVGPTFRFKGQLRVEHRKPKTLDHGVQNVVLQPTHPTRTEFHPDVAIAEVIGRPRKTVA